MRSFQTLSKTLTKHKQRPFAELGFADCFYLIWMCFFLQKPNKHTSKVILYKPLGYVVIPCLRQKLMKYIPLSRQNTLKIISYRAARPPSHNRVPPGWIPLRESSPFVRDGLSFLIKSISSIRQSNLLEHLVNTCSKRQGGEFELCSLN